MKNRKKISNALLGKLLGIKEGWSRESREKMRLAKLGKSNSTKGKPRPNSSGANHPNWQGERLAWFIKSDVLLSIRSGTKLSFIEINFPVFLWI